ncbi:MAG: folate-binding protein YgfZ [Rhizobiaceae bacterium]
MPAIHLTDRSLIDLKGPEAEAFAQNLITTDLGQLGADEAKPGALLSPQGKILFDFLVSRGADGLTLECRADIADDLVRRLTLYRLRAKVEIAKRDQALVAVSWETDSGASQTDSTAGLRDSRFPAPAVVRRFYADPPVADASPADWHAFRIRAGVAESGSDYALGDAFPHDVLLDQNGGVGLRKGCYVGQEVVSRMQHRGTARRRVLLVEADADLPAPGTDLSAGGRTLGAIGSVAGRNGLAIVRIDRVKDAMDAGMPILAGEMPVRLSIPGWARFGFPEAPSQEP